MGKFWRPLTALASQAAASAATVVVSVSAARGMTAEQFGELALIMAMWVLLVGSLRSSTGEIVAYRTGRVNPDRQWSEIGSALSAGLGASAVVGGTLALCSLLLFGGESWAALGLALPTMVLQDNLRFVFVMLNRQLTSLMVDALYITLLVVTLLVIFEIESLLLLMLLWGGCSCVAGVTGLLILRPPLSWPGALKWRSIGQDDLRHFTLDFLVSNGLANSAPFLVALLATLAEAGAIRGSQVLLVPLLLIMRGMNVALAPSLARAEARENRTFVFRSVLRLSAVMTLIVGASVVFVWLVPLPILETLLGESAQATADLFPWAALATLSLGLATAGMMGLKAARQVRVSLRYKLIFAPATLGAMVVATHAWGAAGSQIALSAGELTRNGAQLRYLAAWRRA